MLHTIQITTEVMADLEVSRKQRLERILLEKGTRFQVDVRPAVVETPGGPIEVADLILEDGTICRAIPFSFFHFVEENDEE